MIFDRTFVLLISIGASLALLALRPMFIGYAFTDYGLLALWFFAGLIILFGRNVVGRVEKKSAERIFLTIIACYLPVILAELAFGQTKNSVSSLIIVGSSSVCLFIFFSMYRASRYFLLALYFIFLLTVLSTITTSLLFFFKYDMNTARLESMKLLEIGIRSREDIDRVALYFPFTSLYTYFTTSTAALPRFSFWFMEAGMVSGFFSAIVFLVAHTKSFSFAFFAYFFLLVGGLLTFSTSFAPAFILPPLFYFLMSTRITLLKLLVFSVLLLVSYQIFLRIPLFGFQEKSETHGSSFEDRISWFAFNSENVLRYVRLICSGLLIVLVGKLKSNKKLFMSSMSALFFTGIVNVIFFTPLFLVFCFLDFQELPSHYIRTSPTAGKSDRALIHENSGIDI